MIDFDPSSVRFDERGFVPVIVRNAHDGAVLTLAYMNEESLGKTLESGEIWFWSRSRGELWNKGETSGNRQNVLAITADCDSDALLIDVVPMGPACHTGEESCFGAHATSDAVAPATPRQSVARPAGRADDDQSAGAPSSRASSDVEGSPMRFSVADLMDVIQSRYVERPEGSYVTTLFNSGTDTILKKVGEEATEVVIASKGESRERLIEESSDLLFHLGVLLVDQGITLEEIESELGRRHQARRRSR
jgi:phosphoribosyl-AMP cyclohydrolase / phosphoribosyl-ATP pyrophosphohydrolase